MAWPPLKPHRCTERCVCPIHQEPLYYYPSEDRHACQDPDCKYAEGWYVMWHGMKVWL